MPRCHTAAIGAGLAVGAFGAHGQAHLDGTLEAFANSLSTWLVAPFVVGTLAPTRRAAAAAGLLTCLCQLVGYYAVAFLGSFETTVGLVAFWTAAALAGGPLFGAAGQLWRTPLRGLGTAVLAGVFIAEGAYAYLYEQHDTLTGVLWIAIGVAIAKLGQLRWLAVTVPLGVGGEVVLTAALQRFF